MPLVFFVYYAIIIASLGNCPNVSGNFCLHGRCFRDLSFSCFRLSCHYPEIFKFTAYFRTGYLYSSCAGNKGILVKTPDLNVPFEAQIKIQAGELEMNGNLKRYGTGIWAMNAESPETLAGLELSYGDEGVKAKLGELTLSFSFLSVVTMRGSEKAQRFALTVLFSEHKRQPLRHVDFSRKYGVTVAAKGVPNFVAGSGRAYIIPAGNPGLSRGGSGDVLAGIIASFRAQGLSAVDAAALGVFVHGAAADIAAEELALQALPHEA